MSFPLDLLPDDILNMIFEFVGYDRMFDKVIKELERTIKLTRIFNHYVSLLIMS